MRKYLRNLRIEGRHKLVPSLVTQCKLVPTKLNKISFLQKSYFTRFWKLASRSFVKGSGYDMALTHLNKNPIMQIAQQRIATYVAGYLREITTAYDKEVLTPSQNSYNAWSQITLELTLRQPNIRAF